MSTYQRYRAVYGAEQHLYCSGCPVYVHRYQISADLQTGGRILQVRMVNMSEWEISTVYLRIACLDGQGKALATMYAVPMNNLHAGRSRIFGESITLQLSTATAQMVQVFPERVIFANGMTWNETEAAAYISLPAPLPVKRTDVDFDRLEQQGQRNGVHNDYRYQELENAWYCTCGLPNGPHKQFCGYCGTNREWLRLNMNGRAAIVSQAVEPVLPAEPAQPQTETPAPAQTSDDLPDSASVAELLDYMNAKLERYSTPVAVAEQPTYRQPEEEFPVIDPTPPKKNKAGKVIGIILLVLAIVAAAAFCAMRFLLPMLRYNEAASLEQAGSYAEAREIFTELGDYQDAASRVTGTWYQQALSQMRAGDYAGAYDLFSGIFDYENSKNYAADCIYSLGVLAFNDGDTETAWGYVQQLQEEFPDYSGGQDLYQSCCYTMGSEALDAGAFEDAKSWLALSDGYKNAADLIQYCDYELACKARDEGKYEDAIVMFSDCTYGDSAEQVYACMMRYVKENGSREDELTADYLEQLCAKEYEGAAELYESLYAWTVKVLVSTESAYSKTLKSVDEVDDLNKLYLHYSAEGGRPDATVGIVLIYTLPDGTTGNLVLVKELQDGANGTVSWKDLKLPECKEKGTLKLKFCDAESGEELLSCSVVVRETEQKD